MDFGKRCLPDYLDEALVIVNSKRCAGWFGGGEVQPRTCIGNVGEANGENGRFERRGNNRRLCATCGSNGNKEAERSHETMKCLGSILPIARGKVSIQRHAHLFVRGVVA